MYVECKENLAAQRTKEERELGVCHGKENLAVQWREESGNAVCVSWERDSCPKGEWGLGVCVE